MVKTYYQNFSFEKCYGSLLMMVGFDVVFDTKYCRDKGGCGLRVMCIHRCEHRSGSEEIPKGLHGV